MIVFARALVLLALLNAAAGHVRADAAVGPPPGLHLLNQPFTASSLPFTGPYNIPVSLSDFRGRVVVLDFWATWCWPCVHELPTLARLATAFGPQQLAVVPVVLDDEGIPAGERMLARRKVTTLKAYGDAGGKFADAMRVHAFPTTFVIDPRGRVVARVEGTLDWASPRMVAYLRSLAPPVVAGRCDTTHAIASAGFSPPMSYLSTGKLAISPKLPKYPY